MKVLVFGNVGAGKTTLASILNQACALPYISIDAFRRCYGDGTSEGEHLARDFFFAAVTNNYSQIIECLGIGSVGEELFKVLGTTEELAICIILDVPRETCLSRISYRKWDIPFHKPVENVYSLIDRIDRRINESEIENLWGGRKNTIIIKRPNNNQFDLNEIVNEIRVEIQKW